MGKKLIISESEINTIRGMYGLLMEQVSETPVCTESGCSGKYTGPEWSKNCSDIAHQYSNVITKAVAAKLKELYNSGNYVKVDLDNIKLSATSVNNKCNQNQTTYSVIIPFIKVSNKCDARTGFAHVGGWGHAPELQKRKMEIWGYIPPGKSRNTVVDNLLDVSQLTKTPTGLEEYWIQWKHWDYQSECEKSNSDNQVSSEKIDIFGGPNYKPISNSEADDIRRKIGSLNSTKELESAPKTSSEPKVDPLVKPEVKITNKPEVKSVIRKAKRGVLSPDEEL
jgi:hypothetical protein